LSALFTDDEGKEICTIIRNEWRARPTNWDVETEGNAVTIRTGRGRIALRLRVKPPSKVTVEKIRMYYRGYRIVGDEGAAIEFYLPDGRLWFRSSATHIGSQTAIKFS